ncbi:hypothetical protein B296_00030050 [Ensete ventricosum]|uniref:Uncharacterized protein n=1 Tax=Ensete ventricosum TaxID=4639 RepID=A0A426XAI6_ENSVE|nr:hypothetical protein B296_00030050 [Ensete ventricosum]
MPMNLKEGDDYVVNHGEGMTVVDFGGHVSLAEKEGAGIAERRSGTGHAQQKEWSISYREAIAAAARAIGNDSFDRGKKKRRRPMLLIQHLAGRQRRNRGDATLAAIAEG